MHSHKNIKCVRYSKVHTISILGDGLNLKTVVIYISVTVSTEVDKITWSENKYITWLKVILNRLRSPGQ
jgi:hypothetical protein